MSVIMEPNELEWDWTKKPPPNEVPLKPGERLDIYNGVPYNGKEGGGNCAKLTLSEKTSITIELDLASFQHFGSGGFWVPVGQVYFYPSLKSPSDTLSVPAGVFTMGFDCTIFVKSDIIEEVSGVIIVRVKRGETVIGTFKVKYLIVPESVSKGTLEVHAFTSS